MICPDCGTVHHKVCWDNNKGCANIDCKRLNEDHNGDEGDQNSFVCKKCRAKIENGQLFCPKCGQKVEGETNTVEETKGMLKGEFFKKIG